MATASDPPSADGRTRRSERNRRAMVDAMFELVGEGVLRPTAHQVAERAGVGIRTVFRHFSDMDTLLAELDQRVREEMEPLFRRQPPSGGALERAIAMAANQAGLFERVAPFKRGAALQRRRSPFLQQRHVSQVKEQRDMILRWIPELEHADAGLVDAFEVAMSFESWDRLRIDQRLSARRAAQAMERTIAALARELD